MGLHLSHTFQFISNARVLYLTGAIIKADSNLPNLLSVPWGFCGFRARTRECVLCQCACAHICIPRSPCMRVFVHKRAHICCVWASLKEPQWQYSRGRSKLLVGRAVTIKGGRSVKTSPVLPGWAKVLLKRFFWGTLNVVKWSPPQLGHSKRPSLTSRAKQTPSPLAQPCQFPSNPLGPDPASRYPAT